MARFVQIVANFFGGTCSVGVGRLEDLDCNNGDNGVFRVTREAGKLEIAQSRDGKLNANLFQVLDLDEVRKHAYWQKQDGKKTILESVIEPNKEAFSRQ